MHAITLYFIVYQNLYYTFVVWKNKMNFIIKDSFINFTNTIARLSKLTAFIDDQNLEL